MAESSVYRIKRRFAEDGLDGVLKERPQANRYRKLDDRAGAHCQPGLVPDDTARRDGT